MQKLTPKLKTDVKKDENLKIDAKKIKNQKSLNHKTKCQNFFQFLTKKNPRQQYYWLLKDIKF